MSQLLVEVIVEAVESKPFIKVTEIIPDIAVYWAEDNIDIVAFINKLVDSGEIKAIDYVDADNVPDRIRRRLYPKSYTINGLVKG